MQKAKRYATLAKFRKQNIVQDDGTQEVIFDISPDLFWNDAVGASKGEAPWDLCEEKLKLKFKKHLQKFCSGDHDTDWFVQVLKDELIDSANLDSPVVKKDRLMDFCSTGKDVSLKLIHVFCFSFS